MRRLKLLSRICIVLWAYCSHMAVMRIDFIRDFTFLTSLILLLQFSVILQTSHLYVYLPQTLCKMSVLLPEIELDNSRRLRISAQMVDTGEKMTPKNRFLSFCPGFVFQFKAWSTIDEWQHPDDGKQGWEYRSSYRSKAEISNIFTVSNKYRVSNLQYRVSTIFFWNGFHDFSPKKSFLRLKPKFCLEV